MSRKRNQGSLTSTAAAPTDDQRRSDESIGNQTGQSDGKGNKGRRQRKNSQQEETGAEGTKEPQVADALVGPSAASSSIATDAYDQDFEPLTKKVVRVFKKHRRLANPAPYDSDDSFNDRRDLFHRKDTIVSLDVSGGSDSPVSDETKIKSFEDSTSSVIYSTSDTLIVDDSDYELPQNLLGFKLDSGITFIYMAIPPDGGYGWLVLFLSFLAQLIVDGIIFSIGILLPLISAEFNVSSAQVVLVGSIQIGCYFMGGAFSSALINSYGFRPVAVLGVLCSALALLVASFSSNLLMMIAFYSIIGGPALSMIWVSSQLIIGYYFERYRPIASGFSCSGAGAGIFIFSITNSLLAVRIGWRNTIRVQVVLVLLILFIAMAYLEVSPTPVAVVHPNPINETSSEEYYGNFYVHYFLTDDADSSARTAKGLESYSPTRRKHRRLRRLARCCSPCCYKPPQESDRALKTEEDRNYVVRAEPLQHEDLFYTGPADYDKPHHMEQFDGKDFELVGSDEHMQRAAYRLHKIHEYDSSSEASEILDGTEDSMEASIQAPPNLPVPPLRRKKAKKAKKRHWLRRRSMRALNRLFDVHLLGSFEFRVLLASAFLYPMGLNIPFVYSRTRTTIPLEYAQWIGPAIGATNFIARILCGFVAYKLRDWTSYICGGGMLLGGTMVFISAFYGSDLVWFQLAYGLIYGVAPAVYATLRAIIYVRYLGLPKLTNAFGITALAMGLGVFIGTTFGGFLVGQTGGYTAAFAFAGVCIMLSGGLKLILPSWVKYRESNKNR